MIMEHAWVAHGGSCPTGTPDYLTCSTPPQGTSWRGEAQQTEFSPQAPSSLPPTAPHTCPGNDLFDSLSVSFRSEGSATPEPPRGRSQAIWTAAE
ncbi:hypothetical protein NDU88_000805 [Pleurodeles waltl]|uniref:Uncharacterized protein n=1 Tax=Pleurodeles waltl TaxID=8319 RepID=A0AAV7V6E9_PLEWA|nr:hypothetical protein NDU88_000805 [Pleurodeles waltl]